MTYHNPTFDRVSVFRQVFPDPESIRALTNIVPAKDAVPADALADTLANINRRFTRFPLKNRVMDLYTSGDLVMLSNPDIKVSRILPAWRVRVGGRLKAYVNLTPYTPGGGAAGIDPRRVYGMMQFGAVLVDGLNNGAKLAMSGTILTDATKVYARMMARVADRICGFGVDRSRLAQMQYVFAKYFIARLLGRPLNETIEGAAMAAAGDITQSAADSIQNALASAAKVDNQKLLYNQDLTAFLASMPEAAPWLRRMSARGFVQTYAAQFGDAAFFGMEELTYFLAVLASHESETDLVNSYALESSFDREGANVVNEMARLFR